MDPQLKDIVGTALSMGDTVALDVLSRKRSHLRVGKVVAIEGDCVRVKYHAPGSYRSILRRPASVVKVSS